MEYEDLVKGRRREWEKLKPPEQRRAEAKARREAELAAAEAAAEERHNAPRMRGDKSEDKPRIRKGFFDRRQERMDQARDADVEKFVRARKLSIGLLAVVALLFGGSWFAEYSAKASAREREAGEMARLEAQIQNGDAIELFQTATGALASWRSAWVRKQAWSLWRTFSPRLQQNLVRAKSVPIAVSEYESRMKSGALDGYIGMVRNLDGMDVVRMPLAPYSEGELAIFRSKPLQPANDPTHAEPWIVAIAYSTEVNEWRFADFREAQYFSVKWGHEAAILPRIGGMRATRYDEDGDPLEAIKTRTSAEFNSGAFSGK